MSERMRGRLSKAQEVTVVMVGDANVGKTALVTRFCEDIFIEVSILLEMSLHRSILRVVYLILRCSGKFLYFTLASTNKVNTFV
jgi:GTPase SAR1 family protein